MKSGFLGFGNKKESDANANRYSEKPAKVSTVTNARPAARASSSKPFIGIDVGSRQVKIAIGRFRNNKVTLKNIYSHTVSDKAFYDGKIIKKADVEGCIFNILRENKVALKEAVCTVDSTEVIQRELIMPKVNDNEILSMASYEIGQYLPIDISSYALQYKKLEDFITEQGPQIRVMVCAIPKVIPKDFMSILNGINIRPVAMDINSNALEKLIQLEAAGDPLFASRNIVLIDMGHSLFNISFFKAGTYVFNKMVKAGGFMIDEVIQRTLEAGPLDSEKIKIHNLTKISVLDLYKAYGDSLGSMGDAENNEEIILKGTMDGIEQWVREIDGVLKYYTSRDSNNSIDEILIYGGCAYIKDIDKFLENRLRIRTKRIQDLRCLELGPEVNHQEIPKYLNAISALIRI